MCDNCEEKKDYSKTLNLPKTDFPMRANLPENEPKILEKVLQTKFVIQAQKYLKMVCMKKC